ncbi:MAG: hypothetical protein J6W75_06900 [Bacteroidaceae bacterium]|nr:hypothetical protein [Bacteroidaceae bacterium]
MKKTILFALISAFVFSLSGFAQRSTMKEIIKDAKKQAKELKKAGWVTVPGALPLERQLEDMYIKKNLELDDEGISKWIIGESNPIGEFYDAAKLQANALARTSVAEQMNAEITQIIETSLGNKQLTGDEAASVAQVIAKGKELVSGTLGRTVPVFEAYRKLPNGNVEIMFRVAYSTKTGMAKAKEAYRDALEQSIKGLGEKFDKELK